VRGGREWRVGPSCARHRHARPLGRNFRGCHRGSAAITCAADGATLSGLSRYLFLAGSLPFLVLGVAHVRATPLVPDRPRGLSPADPRLAEEMTRTTLRLTRRVDMWRAWVGFNLSHSLGLLVFGLVVVLVGRSEAVFLQEGRTFVPLALAVSAGYLALAVKYWFRIPIAGSAMGVILFLASWVLLLA
jgi:hypothetical protein